MVDGLLVDMKVAQGKGLHVTDTRLSEKAVRRIVAKGK
jgi:hypothetical protein